MGLHKWRAGALFPIVDPLIPIPSSIGETVIKLSPEGRAESWLRTQTIDFFAFLAGMLVRADWSRRRQTPASLPDLFRDVLCVAPGPDGVLSEARQYAAAETVSPRADAREGRESAAPAMERRKNGPGRPQEAAAGR